MPPTGHLASNMIDWPLTIQVVAAAVLEDKIWLCINTNLLTHHESVVAHKVVQVNKATGQFADHSYSPFDVPRQYFSSSLLHGSYPAAVALQRYPLELLTPTRNDDMEVNMHWCFATVEVNRSGIDAL